MDNAQRGCVDRIQICLGEVKNPNRPQVALKNEGYALNTVRNTLFIQGDGERGVLFGVYGFLENELGCRFYAQDVEKIPTRNALEIPTLDKTVISPFEYREVFWNCMLDTDTAAKRGLNGDHVPADERRGDGLHYYGFSHTMFSYVDPKIYFESHPEYFSMLNGKRIMPEDGRTQVCLTNPDVLEITKKKLRQNIIDHPECKIFGLTQMDWHNNCQCPECKKVDEEEGSPAGSFLRFVNACAASIADEFPDVIIDTFAYQYTRKTPRITKPLPNVCVRLCSIECCFAHPLGQCSLPQDVLAAKDSGMRFANDIEEWGKVCKRLYVWDYTTDFPHYLATFANLRSLLPNIRYFAEHGVAGLFEQGNSESPSGEFGGLRAYLMSRFVWNLDLDPEVEIDDFLQGYYGAAAAPIKKYINLVQDHMDKDDVHMGCFTKPMDYITDELVEAGEKLFAEACKLAENEAVLARVQRSQLQVRYLRLNRTDVSDPAYHEMAENLCRDVRRLGLTRITEAELLEHSLQRVMEGMTNGRRIATH